MRRTRLLDAFEDELIRRSTFKRTAASSRPCTAWRCPAASYPLAIRSTGSRSISVLLGRSMFERLLARVAQALERAGLAYRVIGGQAERFDAVSRPESP